jgi:hypothetical protein
MVEIVALGTIFDSARSFLGEGPVDSIQMVTLAGYCVHSTVVPAIVPKTFFAPSEEIHGKELLLSNGGGCYGKRGKRGT